jgi:hypothetical protein
MVERMTSGIKRKEWDSRRYSREKEAYLLGIYPYIREMQSNHVDVKLVDHHAEFDKRYQGQWTRVFWQEGKWVMRSGFHWERDFRLEYFRDLSLAIRVARSASGRPFCGPSLMYSSVIPEQLVEDNSIELAVKELLLAGYEMEPLYVNGFIVGHTDGLYHGYPKKFQIGMTWVETEASQRWHVWVNAFHGVAEQFAHYSYPDFDEAWDKYKDLLEEPIEQQG